MKITDIYSSNPYIEIHYSAGESHWGETLEPTYSVEVRLNDVASDAITWAYNQMQNIEKLNSQLGINPVLDQAIKNYQESVSTLTVMQGLLGKTDEQ